MNDNVKFLSKETQIAQIASFIKQEQKTHEKRMKMLEGLKALVTSAPIREIDRRADELYEQVKQQKIASVNIKGLYDRNYTKRLFTVLKQRHLDVETKEKVRQGDRKKIIEAWIKGKNEPNQPTETEPVSEDQELEEFIQKNQPTRHDLEKWFKGTRDLLNTKIGKLVATKMVSWDGNKERYKWIGE